MTKRRNIIIGLDGVPYGLLKDFSERGIMPNFKRIIADGVFKQMTSSVPEVSSVAWSSIITGADPAEHGIFGFTDLPVNTYRLSFPNFSHMKVPAFWEKDTASRHIIINVPSTYPARRLNGVLISGFVALDIEKAVYPDSALSVLKNIDYRIDVDSSKAHQSTELFIKDLNRTNEARIAAYRYFWEEDWNTFMLVFTGTDRLMHFLWDACEDKGHDFHREFTDYFRRVDEAVGEIFSKKRDEDNFLVLSDHGFEKLEKDVYVNNVLKKSEFLKLQSGKGDNFSKIDEDTKAFALDPARIYINMKGKYPRGGVNPEEREHVIKDIEDLFHGLKIGSKNAVNRIYRKEEIYKGPYIDRAPDLILIGNNGFNMKASLASEDIYSKGVFTGKHTKDDAFLLINGRYGADFVPEHPNVCDIVGIIGRLK